MKHVLHKILNIEVPASEPWRRTGQTTIQCFDVIARAMARPGCIVSVKDHHGSAKASEELRVMIIQTLQKLEMKEFKVERQGVVVLVQFG